MSEERERYEVSGQEHAADGARTAKRSAGLSTENPNAPQQRAHRIRTPCPSCGGRTLFVGSGGHLTCSYLECPQPVVETAIEILQIRAGLTDHLRDLAVEEERKKLRKAWKDYQALEYFCLSEYACYREIDHIPGWNELAEWQRKRLKHD